MWSSLAIVSHKSSSLVKSGPVIRQSSFLIEIKNCLRRQKEGPILRHVAASEKGENARSRDAGGEKRQSMDGEEEQSANSKVGKGADSKVRERADRETEENEGADSEEVNKMRTRRTVRMKVRTARVRTR